jgi:hypothetical protein
MAIAASLLVASAANAGEIVCSGTVVALSYHANNTFRIQLSSMNVPVFFCRTDQTFTVPGTTYSTAPETCRALIAVFLAARESGRTISSVYFDGDDVPATCNSWVNWRSANIRTFLY